MITISILIALVGGTVYWGLHLESLGKDPQGARQRRIEQSPQFRNGSFHNLTNTPVQSDDANYFTLLNKFFFDKNPKVAPPVPIPNVKTDLHLPPSAKPTITYFGHSSYLLQIEGHNILVDPVFSARTSPVQFLGTKGLKGRWPISSRTFRRYSTYCLPTTITIIWTIRPFGNWPVRIYILSRLWE